MPRLAVTLIATAALRIGISQGRLQGRVHDISAGTYHVAVRGLHYDPVDPGTFPSIPPGRSELEVKVDRVGDCSTGDRSPVRRSWEC